MGATAAVAFGVQAVGSFAQGQAGYEAEKANARVASINAALSRKQTVEEVADVRRTGRLAQGDLRAEYSATSLTGASALAVMEQSAAVAELDALRAQYTGDLRTYGYLTEAAQAEARAKNAKTAGLFGAASSALLGASKVK